MPVVNIKSQDQYQGIISGSGLSAIQFYAPWDAPSVAIRPKFDGFSNSDRYKNKLSFYSVDINDQLDVAMDSGVKMAPTFRFYSEGKQIGEYVGDSYPALERSIASHIA